MPFFRSVTGKRMKNGERKGIGDHEPSYIDARAADKTTFNYNRRSRGK